MRLSPIEQPSFTEYTLPEGKPGVIATLRLMRQLAREYKKHPDIVFLSRSLIAGARPKDWIDEIRRVFFFVRDSIRYTLDINDVETLLTPTQLLAIGQGDCDDKAVLLAALLESVGHPARFIAVGENPGELSHVYVETRVGSTWIPLDATESHDIGWTHPGIVERYTVHL